MRDKLIVLNENKKGEENEISIPLKNKIFFIFNLIPFIY